MITPENKFLEESAIILEQLLAELRCISYGFIPQDYLYKLARLIHTIKGTAHTFELKNLSDSSHNFENCLEEIIHSKFIGGYQPKKLLNDGLNHLLSICRDKEQITENDFPLSFENSRKLSDSDSSVCLSEIPAEFIKQISHCELKNLKTSLAHGKKIYVIKNHYFLNEFAEKFKKLQDFLNDRGKIVAFVAFDYRENTSQKGFKTLYSTDLQRIELAKHLDNFNSEIEFQYDPHINFKESLKKVFRHIIRDCRKTITRLNKNATFTTRVAAEYISPRNFVIIRDSAAHLFHNAIDHGIEDSQKRIQTNKPASGKISLYITDKKENISILIKDDGRGIDTEEIRNKAVKNNIIGQNENLCSKEILNLVFLKDFSTASQITDLSGRGIGLNAVKKMVESIGGSIEIESRHGVGTSFLILLPRE